MYCEMPTVYCHDKPKARKEHKCCECHGIITVGEVYHKHHGIWDGDASTYKVCDDCETLRGVIDADCSNTEYGTPFTGLCESVFEMGDANIMATFIEIQERRGAIVPQWMKDRVDDEINKTDEKEELYVGLETCQQDEQ